MVKIKLSDGARMPQYKTAGASGFDIEANEDVTLGPNTRAVIQTGYSFEVPTGQEIQIRPRSGLASKGIDAVFGTLDSDYRGELYVILHNHSDKQFDVRRGMRIAQGVICMLITGLTKAEELSETERGTGGLGSTGV